MLISFAGTVPEGPLKYDIPSPDGKLAGTIYIHKGNIALDTPLTDRRVAIVDIGEFLQSSGLNFHNQN